MAIFNVPETIITGPGCIHELAGHAARYGRKALVVVGTGSALAGGRLAHIEGPLRSEGLQVQMFEGVKAEPPCEQIDQVRRQIEHDPPDVVIGIGGGSVIDAAKAVAILIHSDRPTAEHVARQQVPPAGLPVIAAPTTAGTGSEATGTSVLTDTDKRMKRSIKSPAMMPKVAIVDAELTCSCPPSLTAAAGMDALTQAIESFCSKGATSLTDALAEKAVPLIVKHLERAWRDGEDLAARSALAEASLLAGMALANARLGAVHGLAHPIGVKCSIPHGLACAVLLPVVLAFNRPVLAAGADKYGRLTELMGGDPITVCRNLLDTLGLPKDFTSYPVDRTMLDALAEEAMLSGSTRANPRQVTVEDLKAILLKVIG